MLRFSTRFPPVLLLGLALAVTISIYGKGLQGPFVFDDWPNIVNNHRIAIDGLGMYQLRQAALSSLSGDLGRPVSMLTFALNYYATGLDTFYFKATNLLIHLLNGLGLFLLTRLLLNTHYKNGPALPESSQSYIHWISLAVAAAWLVHPLNLTSVLYVVQRMTSLSALFCIWGLVLFSWGRARMCEGRNGFPAVLASLLVFLPLAVFSKENGILLPGFMLAIELTIFRFQAASISARRLLVGFYSVAVALPAMAALYYLITRFGAIQGGYIVRDFTLSERLMTEARVLWFYISQIITPSTTKMGLYHDDIAISRSLFEPATTALAATGLALLLATALASIRKAPILALGLLLFFVGHVLESTILALEIAHEHRNYLPMYGIVLIVFYYLLSPLRYPGLLRLRYGVAVILVALFSLNTFHRAGQWADPLTHAEAEVFNHPDSPRAHGQIATLYSSLVDPYNIETSTYYLQALHHYQKEVELDRTNTHGIFGVIFLQSKMGSPTDASWINELAVRLEHAPFSMYSGPQLVELTNCHLQGACKISAQDLDLLVQAALRNRTLVPATRANVYTALHLYRLHIEDDLPGAIEALQQTVAAMPSELEYRLNLINFFVIKEHLAHARQELAALKMLDTQQRYTEIVADLDKLLSSKGH